MTSRPKRITNQIVERNVHMQRNLDAQRRELHAFADENAKLSSVASAQSKIEVRRREAQQQACKNEQQYESRIRQEVDNRRLLERTKTQDAALASELDHEALEYERKRLDIQRICDDAPQLRELEHALKVAYLNKERAAQYEEKLLIAAKEQARIIAIEQRMEIDRQRAIAADGDKIGIKKEQFMQQRVILERQMREKEDQLKQAKLQTEYDKQVVDEIVQRINDEDEMDLRRRRELQASTARMVKEFEDQRKREIASAKLAAKLEEDRIMAYNRAVEARSEGVAAKKQAKRDEEDRILQKIVEETARKKVEEDEFNSLRDLLWEEELEAKRAAEQQLRKDRQSLMKREMMEANEHMLQSKAELKMREMEKEAVMVSLMRKKFAEDEAIERAEEEQRRQNKVHHKSLIEKQKSDRRQLYDDEQERERELARQESQREEYRRRVVQEARKRLLEEHAQKLKGFLPGTVFHDSEEYRQYYPEED